MFIVAESAEPKSITEIRGAGFKMYAVKKQKIQDSLKQVHQYNLFITSRSLNIIKEFNGYMYPIDKNYNIISSNPIGPDHAIDAIRYFLIMKNRVWK